MSLVNVQVTFQTTAEKKEEAMFKLLEIFVSPEQQVTKEEPLAEIDTDKGIQEIESPASGTVKDIFLVVDAEKEYSYKTIFCTIETA